ncbi:MAG: hypothetical protein ACO1SV_03505 [Fimbriimonas sp.]
MSPRAKLLVAISTLAAVGGLSFLALPRDEAAWLAPYPAKAYPGTPVTVYTVPGPPSHILPAARAWAKAHDLTVRPGHNPGEAWLVDSAGRMRFGIDSGRVEVNQWDRTNYNVMIKRDSKVTSVTHFREPSLWSRLLDRLIPPRKTP